ncbi:MAG: hypothetical protein J0I20_15895 [Chloroflexi bacterium]|nr:hypothetical protein [Chloroflexota bacterium]OJV91221.1 MAG: hypothetical protein BGO39_26575 [Chloroflexi bacterium 54-19]
MLAPFSLPLIDTPILALLHGNYVDDALVVGVVLYLIAMLILARFRAKQLKRQKEKKAAKKLKALPREEGPDPDNPVHS